jgi:hypothetical protein
MNKGELLSNIRHDRAALGALVSSLSEALLAERESDAGWSVTDHLSHLAAWERMIVAHLHDGTDAEIAGMDATAYAAATLDELNDRLYRRSRDRSVADTLREYAEARQAIVTFIGEMPEERLATPYWDDDPSARTVLDKIAGDTYLHYKEHAGWIRELVGRPAEAQ